MRTGRRSRPRPVPDEARAVESRTRDEMCFLLQGAVLGWGDVTGKAIASHVGLARAALREEMHEDRRLVGGEGGTLRRISM